MELVPGATILSQGSIRVRRGGRGRGKNDNNNDNDDNDNDDNDNNDDEISLELPLGSISDWPGYEEGKWWVQDVSYTLPALALSDALSGRATGFAPGVGILGRQQRKAPQRRPTVVEEEEEEEKGASAATTDVSEMHVVDMCAAPGKKSCQLLPFGFRRVTAVEADSRQCRRLRENLERMG